MSKNIVVYPISANPPTFGHADILVRASRCFEQVYWVAAINSTKQSTIAPKVQLEMMRDYVEHFQLKNIHIEHFEGSLVRFAMSKQARFILRGIRNITDMQSEMDLATGYRGVSQEIETICFFSTPGLTMVSSSLVKELARVGENIDQYVLPSVAEILMDYL
ncbi:MAG: pantetheine-phosphate adenylyltransferase [Deltaproteobacteria bacterium]|nr:pantetheine-phosphate adenylyltransferase [Deltaproteobacteria bacterium]